MVLNLISNWKIVGLIYINLVLHIILLFCWAISYDNCCILHVLCIPLIFNMTISIHTDLQNETIKWNWIWIIFLEFQEFHSCAQSAIVTWFFFFFITDDMRFSQQCCWRFKSSINNYNATMYLSCFFFYIIFSLNMTHCSQNMLQQ